MRAAHLISELLMLARAEPEALQVEDLVPTDLTTPARAVVADTVPAGAKRGLILGWTTRMLTRMRPLRLSPIRA
jgi:two-component system sensor histidine kinase TctE